MHKYIASFAFSALTFGVAFLAAPAAHAQYRDGDPYFTDPDRYDRHARDHYVERGDFGRRERGWGDQRSRDRQRGHESERGRGHCRSNIPGFCQEMAELELRRREGQISRWEEAHRGMLFERGYNRRLPFVLVDGRRGECDVQVRRDVPPERRRDAFRMGLRACADVMQMSRSYQGRGRGGFWREFWSGFGQELGHAAGRRVGRDVW